MKKDVVYSIRMSTAVREALKRAARKERRTVASLLDKIILDYLENEGLVLESEVGADRRRFQRKKITLPASSVLETGSVAESYPCVILDISMGGVLLTYPKGSEIRVNAVGELPQFDLAFKPPQATEELRFRCSARRMTEKGGEIQVGATFSETNDMELRKLQTYLM